MNFIKKIFDGKKDCGVHYQFQKFGRGEFKDRALILAKKTGNKYVLSTSPEFANELVLFCAKLLGKGRAKVAGAVISTGDMKGILDFKEIKQFQGVKKYLIEKEMSGEEIFSLVDKFPRAFFALSFKCGKDSTDLKIKPKSPKSAKPGKSAESNKPQANFCKLTTENAELAQSFVFEKPGFKKAFINHTYIIKEIKISKELKDEENFAKIREESLRKGVLIREADIDGQKIKREIEFEV